MKVSRKKSLINSIKTCSSTFKSKHLALKSKRKIEKVVAIDQERCRLAPLQTKAAKQLNIKFKRMPELPLKEKEESLLKHSLPNARAQRVDLLMLRNLNNR